MSSKDSMFTYADYLKEIAPLAKGQAGVAKASDAQIERLAYDLFDIQLSFVSVATRFTLTTGVQLGRLTRKNISDLIRFIGSEFDAQREAVRAKRDAEYLEKKRLQAEKDAQVEAAYCRRMGLTTRFAWEFRVEKKISEPTPIHAIRDLLDQIQDHTYGQARLGENAGIRHILRVYSEADSKAVMSALAAWKPVTSEGWTDRKPIDNGDRSSLAVKLHPEPPPGYSKV